MHERANDVDKLVSVSHFFAGVMKERMNLSDGKIQTIHLGVDIEDYNYISTREKPRNVGYISRMCHKDGFDIVVDAFIDLKKKLGFEDVKLIDTAGTTGDDAKFLKEQKRKLKENNLLEMFEILPEFGGEASNNFFKKVVLVSVPVRIGEAFGMYMLESMASGVPVVQPALGAFPEIIEISGGGVTYMPNTPEKLSETWAERLTDSEKLEKLSVAGYEGTKKNFNIHNHAQEIITLYESLRKQTL